MANTFTSLHYHFVFSTKNRERWLSPEIEQRIWEYLGGIARQNQMKALQIGGMDDHVHLVVGMPPTLAVSRGATDAQRGLFEMDPRDDSCPGRF